jgi:hypothetical protein
MSDTNQSTWFDPPDPVLQAWKRAMDSMLNGDRAAARASFAEDAVWYDIFTGTLRGADAIADHLSTLRGSAFDTSSIDVVNAVADDRIGALEWTQTLITGDRRATLEGTTWITVENGVLSRLCDYFQPLKNRKP